MTNNADLFLEISAILTGFNKAELQGTGMVESYFNYVSNTPSDAQKANLDFFFAKVQAILKETKGDEQALEFAVSDQLMPISAYNNMAQNIITLWYTGNWGQNVVSAQSYIQGLMWDTAEAHPPGAKQPGFGSWSLPPL